MIDRKTMILVIVMVFFFICLAYYSVTEFATPFISIKDLDSSGGRIQVKGAILNGTIQWNPINSELRFILSEDDYSVPVLFNGEKPNGFEGDKTVVVIGEYDDGVINATQILVKCPSKYEEK